MLGAFGRWTEWFGLHKLCHGKAELHLSKKGHFTTQVRTRHSITWFCISEIREMSLNFKERVQRNAQSCKNFRYKATTLFHIPNTWKFHEWGQNQHLSSFTLIYHTVKEIVIISSGTAISENNQNWSKTQAMRPTLLPWLNSQVDFCILLV